MNNTFFIADTHFGDESIIIFENRPFSTSKEMDHAIIHNWNSNVKKEDCVFILGDYSFYDFQGTKTITQKLNGYKILVLGNHDMGLEIDCWKDAGIDEVYKYPIIFNKYFILSHEPIYMSKNMPYINVHGHLHHLTYNDTGFFNVCLENINYTPINAETVYQKYKSDTHTEINKESGIKSQEGKQKNIKIFTVRKTGTTKR